MESHINLITHNFIPEQPCHKVEPAAVRVAKDVLLDTMFSRRLDHLEEYSHHELGALSAVPLHRRELDGEEVVKVLRSEWRARCQRRSFCLPRGFRHTNKFVIFNLAAISTFGSDLQH